METKPAEACFTSVYFALGRAAVFLLDRATAVFGMMILAGISACALTLFMSLAEAASSCDAAFARPEVYLSHTQYLKDRFDQLKGGGYVKGIPNRPYTETEIASIEDYAAKSYGESGSEKLAKLRQLSESFEALIVDPGLMMRIEGFVVFVQANSLQGQEPWSVRDRYSRHLGKEVFYRAVAVTGAEHDKILKQGFESGLLRESARLVNSFVPDMAWNLSVHVFGSSLDSNFISVTKFPSVAIAVAKSAFSHQWIGAQKKIEERRVFLFKLKIPTLDLIDRDGEFREQRQDKIAEMDGLVIQTGLLGLSTRKLDRNLESFGYGVIPAEDILEVREISVTEQSVMFIRPRRSIPALGRKAFAYARRMLELASEPESR